MGMPLGSFFSRPCTVHSQWCCADTVGCAKSSVAQCLLEYGLAARKKGGGITYSMLFRSLPLACGTFFLREAVTKGDCEAHDSVLGVQVFG